MNQVIISIGREFGSGGHELAEKLAARLKLNFYDSNLLAEVATDKAFDKERLSRYDEKPRNRLISRTVNGHSNSPEENVANMQFEFLRKKAESGESFVIVGRCADTILKDYDSLISIFIIGDRDKKIARIVDKLGISEKDAKAKMLLGDKKRKAYHNYYSDSKWGDSRSYDLCININRLGFDKTLDIIERYVKLRIS